MDADAEMEEGTLAESAADEVKEPPVKQARLAPKVVPKRTPRPRGSLALEETFNDKQGNEEKRPAPSTTPGTQRHIVPTSVVRPNSVGTPTPARALIRPTGLVRPTSLRSTPLKEEEEEESTPEASVGFDRGMIVTYDDGKKVGYIDMKLDGADVCYLCDEETKASILTEQGKSRPFEYSELRWDNTWTDKIQVEEVLKIDPYTMRRLAAKEDLEVELFQKWNVVVQLDPQGPSGPQILFGPSKPASVRAVMDVMKKNIAMLRTGKDPFTEASQQAADAKPTTAHPKPFLKAKGKGGGKNYSNNNSNKAMAAEGVWRVGDPAEATGQQGRRYSKAEWEAWNREQAMKKRKAVKIEVDEDDDDTWGDWKPEDAVKKEPEASADMKEQEEKEHDEQEQQQQEQQQGGGEEAEAAEQEEPGHDEFWQGESSWGQHAWGQNHRWAKGGKWGAWQQPWQAKKPAPPSRAAQEWGGTEEDPSQVRVGQPFCPPEARRAQADWRFKKKPYLINNLGRRVTSVGILVRRSKDMSDVGPDKKGIMWGAEVEGIDEGDGWLKLPDWDNQYLPMEMDGVRIAFQLRRWRADSSELEAAGLAMSSGLAIRLTKSLLCPPVDRVQWDTEVMGVDEGNGWVLVKTRYIPTHFQNGQRVLVPVEDEDGGVVATEDQDGVEEQTAAGEGGGEETGTHNEGAVQEDQTSDKKQQPPVQHPKIQPTKIAAAKQPQQPQQPKLMPLWARIEDMSESLIDKFDTSSVAEYVRPKKAPPPPAPAPAAAPATEAPEQSKDAEPPATAPAAEGAPKTVTKDEEGDGGSPVYDEPLSNNNEEVPENASKKKQDTERSHKPQPPKGPPPPEDAEAPNTPPGIRAEAAKKKASTPGPLPIGADTPAFPAGGATPFGGGAASEGLTASAISAAAAPTVTLPTGDMTIEDWAENQQQFAHLPPLPPNWVRIRSKKSGQIYYVNTRTGHTQFNEPSDLPVGWTKVVSRSTGRVYYFHALRNVSTFDKPTS
mmetsp:Transcript_21649/g.47128  ORF Transcript_21649/g.47128 Transcript_21649/m.47128 type:complete len:1001 (+) Transcript_21649:353-3355(+)